MATREIKNEAECKAWGDASRGYLVLTLQRAMAHGYHVTYIPITQFEAKNGDPFPNATKKRAYSLRQRIVTPALMPGRNELLN